MAETRARQRWRLLAAAVIGRRNYAVAGSVREFSTYNLVQFRSHPGEPEWRQVTLPNLTFDPGLLVKPPDCQSKITIDSLVGFNNTGNVCIWPSEEIATYWIAKNADLFRDSKVLELGAGSTGLAGIILAMTANPRLVVLSDGNESSVRHIAKILLKNNGLLTTNENHIPIYISCYRWGSDDLMTCSDDYQSTAGNRFVSISDTANRNDQNSQDSTIMLNGRKRNASETSVGQKTTKSIVPMEFFDVILANDCFFFDDSRDLLVTSIVRHLRVGGVGYFWAPDRDGTVGKFVESISSRKTEQGSPMFGVTIKNRYDDDVWRVATEAAQTVSNVYIPELHYPFLVHVVRWR